MSHYTVGVIIPKFVKEHAIETYLDKMLAPFNENLEVEPYIAYTKDKLVEMYKEYKDSMKKRGNDDIISFEEYSEDYAGYGLDEEGNALSRYNPDSKWDWYVIGGRWDGLIETKNSEQVNYARIKDILFEKQFDDLQLANLKKDYEKLLKEGDFYIPEYYQKRYPTFESYVKSMDFSTYALLDEEGTWHEAGKMGWFGASSSTPDEQKDFEDRYMDIINAQDKDNWLVVVDCHI